MKPIIRVENLSKEYKIGASREPYTTLRESIVNSVKAPLQRRRNGADKTFQVLKNINFEVMPGEIVGVIGRNGAGKSTLLKILSRITEPTSGRIELYGRVGSLLEVGTGFHPELTGRENIFLNGAILGMKRGEIVDKFDEIAAFAEIGDFLDTPVKRYSSGMYTRLAFSVAAHLESEVLVVDEVLAVGDAEFQKKCLGKMKDVSHSGRTVLFVSHNMIAVKNLCRRAIFLQKGELRYDSTADAAVEMYLQTGVESASEREWANDEMPGNDNVKIKRVAVYAENKLSNDIILTSSDVVFEIEFYNNTDDADLDVTWDLMDTQGAHVAHIGTICSESRKMKRGFYRTTGVFPRDVLNTKRYVLSVQFGRSQRELLLRLEDVLSFEVEDGLSARGSNFNQLPGVVHPKCEWKTVAES